MTEKFKLVHVEWDDPNALAIGTGWLTREQVEGSIPFRVRTVGWIVKETKDLLILAAQQTVPSEGYEDNFDLVMRIPKAVIRKRRVIK